MTHPPLPTEDQIAAVVAFSHLHTAIFQLDFMNSAQGMEIVRALIADYADSDADLDEYTLLFEDIIDRVQSFDR
jgi:hypothetical protein